jgi:hypothetical protein
MPGLPIEYIGETGDGGACADELGTIGALLVEPAAPTQVWLLSANHVIGFNGRCAQPSITVTGGGPTLSGLTRCVILSEDKPNTVDAAIGRCLPGFRAVGGVQGLVPGVADPSEVPANTVVFRLGAGDNARISGNVGILATRVEIDLGDLIACAEFANQWLIQDSTVPFSRPGDSGSFVVALLGTDRRPFGMVIANNSNAVAAGDKQFSVVTPFGNILSSLNGQLQMQLELFTGTTDTT